MNVKPPQPILIVGPTASGKSALASQLAQQRNGVVINADALQVYEGWRILTARPSADEEAATPHRLYGHVALSEPNYSVGAWLRELAPLLAELEAAGQTPIIVGGTGLYFSKLTQGLAEIPAIAPEQREEADSMLNRLGLKPMFERFAELDPKTAARLDWRNPRRLTRAWEVLAGTGKGLAQWAAETPPPLIPPHQARRIALVPDRDQLAERIERRLWIMVETGALEETSAVLARGFDLASPLPGLKALGARDFADHLAGCVSLEEAVARAAAGTRQFAKRQRTWVRNQLSDWPVAETPDAALDLVGLG